MSLPLEIVVHSSIPNASLLSCEVSLLVVKFGPFLLTQSLLIFSLCYILLGRLWDLFEIYEFICGVCSIEGGDGRTRGRDISSI